MAEGRGVGANDVFGVENVRPANLVIPANSALGGNGRPRRACATLCDYSENSANLDDEIGTESPMVQKRGTKRRLRRE